MQQVQQLKKAALDTVLAAPMIVQEIPLSAIRDNPFQKRKSYGDIKGLADSIAARGLMNPISLIKLTDTNFPGYVIVSGHRRVRAFRDLHRKSIPAIVRRESTEKDLAFDIAIENLQRKDLTPVEVGETLLQMLYTIPSVQNNPSRAQTLINQIKLSDRRGEIGTDFTGKYGFREEDLFIAIKTLKLVSISPNTATAYIRILQLPEEITCRVVTTSNNRTDKSIPEGMLSVKTAYELTRITDTELQKDMCNKIVSEKLKYINVKFMVDEIVENNSAVQNRNLGKGRAARRSENDAGAAELADKLFELSSTVWNFRRLLPLVCRRLDKILWVAALNKMKKACLEMVHNCNELLREYMGLEDYLEEANADLELVIRDGSDHDSRLRFTLPKEKTDSLNLQPGDKLLIKIEGIVRAVQEVKVRLTMTGNVPPPWWVR